jgi:hypothetical protein
MIALVSATVGLDGGRQPVRAAVGAAQASAPAAVPSMIGCCDE